MQVRMSMASLGVVVATLAVAYPVAAQQKVEAKQVPAASECTLALTPQALKVQADPFQVKAVMSQAIGQVGAATIQEENSGLEVAMAAGAAEAAATPAPGPTAKPSTQPAPAAPAAAPAAAAATQALQLTLNTAAAKPGDWTIAVRGENGTCTGRIHVDAAGPKQ